jgi:hypothetical protein
MDFLDITLTKNDTNLNTSVYNKTDAFPFAVTRYSEITSNVHSSMAYSIFYGELVRYVRICSQEETFIKRTSMLTKIFLDKGYDIQRLTFTAAKFSLRYKDNLSKIGPIDEPARALLIQKMFQ